MCEPTDRAGGSQEAWRWRADTYYTKHHTIMVLEPHADTEAERKKRREGQPTVPFGFGRVLAPPPTPVEPLLWEGDGA